MSSKGTTKLGRTPSGHYVIVCSRLRSMPLSLPSIIDLALLLLATLPLELSSLSLSAVPKLLCKLASSVSYLVSLVSRVFSFSCSCLLCLFSTLSCSSNDLLSLNIRSSSYFCCLMLYYRCSMVSLCSLVWLLYGLLPKCRSRIFLLSFSLICRASWCLSSSICDV